MAISDFTAYKTELCQFINSAHDSFNSKIENLMVSLKPIKEKFGSAFDYYNEDRFVFHGLPASIATASVCGRLFCGVSPLIGALYGTLSYASATILVESTTRYSNKNNLKAISILTISNLAASVFIKNILSIQLSKKTFLVLSLASFSGHIFRDHFIDN
jgi:hypothetical protein